MRIGNSPTHINERRIGALGRLEAKAEHTEKDNLEIGVLKARIVSPEVARSTKKKINRGPK